MSKHSNIFDLLDLGRNPDELRIIFFNVRTIVHTRVQHLYALRSLLHDGIITAIDMQIATLKPLTLN